MAPAPLLFSQIFAEYPPPSPFQGLFGSSIAFSDVDGDGDEDVLVAGSTYTAFTEDYCTVESITKLYLNDGTGIFTELPDTPFEGVSSSSIAFSDVNGDGAADVLITGWNSSGTILSKLYTNDGNGNFTEVMDTPFEEVSSGSIAFSDVNGDGAADVLITGWNSSGAHIAKLYTNNGSGEFSEVPDTPFEGVSYSSVAFADIDGNGAPDVLITGRNGSGDAIAKLYTNDGGGGFLELPDTTLEGVYDGAVAFSDVDGNGAVDLLLTGNIASYDPISRLYLNDGAGHFSEGMDLVAVFDGSVAFSDIDGNGTSDVLITGSGNNDVPTTSVYLNDGAGHFSEKTDTPFIDLARSSVAISDVNGDGSDDVLTIGAAHSWFLIMHPIAKLYLNDGEGNFSEMQAPPFVEVDESSIAFSDVNGDGAADLLITGSVLDYSPITRLYTNDGNGNFTEVPDTPFEGIAYGSVAFSDVNGDGSEDVLLVGGGMSKLYLNDGSGEFSEVMDTPFAALESGSVAFSDVNGDGSEDVLIAGYAGLTTSLAILYLNDGSGHFTKVQGAPFEGVRDGSVAFSDVDGNGAADVLITGINNSNSFIAKLYLNDGSGQFSEVMDTPFAGVYQSSIAFSDIDGNGFEDVLITGSDSSFIPIAKMYLNDGTGFTEMADTPIEGVSSGSVAFSDANGDGFEDLLLTGYDTSYQALTKMYLNDGLGNFSELPDEPFVEVAGSSIAFSDVNGDGRPDVVITGRQCTSALTTKLYLNQTKTTSAIKVWGEELGMASVYPNPGSGGKVVIEYISPERSSLQISLFDLNGRRVRQISTEVSAGSNSIPFETLALPKGMYFLSLDDGIRVTALKLVVL